MKPASARSRLFCDLLPWIAAASTPAPEQVPGHLVGAVLGAGEHDGAGDRGLGHELGEHRLLGRLVDMDHALLDPLDRGRGRDDLDRRRVLEQLGRERGDVVGQGGREEQALALLRHMAHHAPDGVDEADVEHAVDLVQDHDLDPVEPDRALAQMVDQPARRRHQDVDAARHDPLLAAHVDATEDDGGSQAQVPAVGPEAVLDLAGQLAGGCQHQDAAGMRQERAALGRQPMQDRQREGRRLAGAGLGDAQKVAAGQDMGDRLRLDGRGQGVALGRERFEQRGREAEIGKLGQGSFFRLAAKGTGHEPSCRRAPSSPGLGRKVRPACLGELIRRAWLPAGSASKGAPSRGQEPRVAVATQHRCGSGVGKSRISGRRHG